jgi:hypothetical protein
MAISFIRPPLTWAIIIVLLHLHSTDIRALGSPLQAKNQTYDWNSVSSSWLPVLPEPHAVLLRNSDADLVWAR